MENVGIGIAAAGLAMAIGRLLRLQFVNINNDALDAQLLKLLKAGNRDRAIKLLGAAAGAMYGRMLLPVFLEMRALDGEQDVKVIGDRLSDVFSKSHHEETARVGRLGFVVYVAPVLAAAGVAVGSTAQGDALMALIGIAVGTLALSVAGWRNFRRMRDRSVEGFFRILDEVAPGYEAE